MERSERANDFLNACRVLALAKGDRRTALHLAEMQRLPRVAETIKGVIAAASTANASTLVQFPAAAAGFLESLRSISVFDRLLGGGGMIRAPLYTRSIIVTTGATGANPGEGETKPISSLQLDGSLLRPIKTSATVVATEELLKFGAPTPLFDSELRRAISSVTNATFLAGLIAATTPSGSAGSTAANVLTDLNTLLGAITTVSESSRLYFIVTGTAAKGLATKINTAGVLQFPNFGVQNGGEVLPGITGLISNDLPASTAVMVDASQLLAGDEGVTIDTSRQATIQLNTSPDFSAGCQHRSGFAVAARSCGVEMRARVRLHGRTHWSSRVVIRSFVLMTPEQHLERTRARLRATMAKAVNVPRGDTDDLAQRLAQGMKRSAVAPGDAALVTGIMRAIAPFIRSLQDEIAELRARIDELER